MYNLFGFCVDYEKLQKTVGKNGIGLIKKSCTISTKGNNDIIKKITCFNLIKIDDVNYFIIPKIIGLKLVEKKIIEYEYKLEQTSGVIFNSVLVLNNNQQLVCNHLTKIFLPCSINSSCVIQSDPGTGKTYIAGGMIHILQKKTMIIVPNVYLLKQTVDVMKSLFPTNIIGSYYGMEKTDGDIIVSVINSALHYENYKNIGLLP